MPSCWRDTSTFGVVAIRSALRGDLRDACLPSDRAASPAAGALSFVLSDGASIPLDDRRVSHLLGIPCYHALLPDERDAAFPDRIHARGDPDLSSRRRLVCEAREGHSVGGRSDAGPGPGPGPEDVARLARQWCAARDHRWSDTAELLYQPALRAIRAARDSGTSRIPSASRGASIAIGATVRGPHSIPHSGRLLEQLTASGNGQGWDSAGTVHA